MATASRKSLEIPPFLVMDVLEKAQEMERAGRDVVHLEVGEPDFDTPPAVVDHAIRSVRAGHTHYTHSMGRLDLREAICRFYEAEYGTPLSPDRVVVTSGSSPALLLAFMLLCDPGDEIVLSNPHYACYPNLIRFGGGTPVFVPVDEGDGFELHADAVKARIGPRTRAILINSPANPMGTLLSERTMRDLADLGVPILSDEIYHGLVYEGRAHSILEYTDDAIVVNGFSKRFAMTGWRLGYAILPPALVRPYQKMQQNFFISAGDFVQACAPTALFECEDAIGAMRAEYDRRRRLVVRRVREMGLGVAVEPQGAFYVFANAKPLCAATGLDCLALAFHILEEAGVAVAPGSDFGSGGEGFLRISYANRFEKIEIGLDRLEGYLREHL